MCPKMHTSSWICLQLETHSRFMEMKSYISLYPSSSRDGITLARFKCDRLNSQSMREPHSLDSL
jgi:hypothetical protein